MENEKLPTTSHLVQMLLDSFAENDGRDNFGYIIATFEKVDGEILFSSGISTNTREQTVDLTDTLTEMFQQIRSDEEDEAEDRRNLGYN